MMNASGWPVPEGEMDYYKDEIAANEQTDEDDDVIIAGDGTKQDCPHEEAVKWNPYNQVVQCHRCGQIFIPKP